MQLNRSLLLAIAALAGIGALSFSSHAGPTVELKWTGTTGSGTAGSDSITVSGSQTETLTLDLVIIGDEHNMIALFVSLRFDSDLGDELNIVSFQELGWTSPNGKKSLQPFAPGIFSTQESTGSLSGLLYVFENTTGGSGPKNTSWTFGRIVFETNPAKVSTDGSDIESGAFAPDGSGSGDGIFVDIVVGDDLVEKEVTNVTSSVSFGTATVNKQ